MAAGFQQPLIILGILAFSVLVVSFPLLSSRQMAGTLIRWILSALLTLAIFAMGISVCFGRYGRQNQERRPAHQEYGDQIALFLEKYSPLLGIFIFGAGSLYMRVFFLLSASQCIGFYWDPNVTIAGNTTPPEPINEHKNNQFSFEAFLSKAEQPMESPALNSAQNEQLAAITLIVLHIIFFLLKIPFLAKVSLYTTVRMPPSSFTHQVLLMIIVADCGDWIYNFFREIGLIFYYPQHPYDTPDLRSLSTACLEYRTVMYSYEATTLGHAFFPLTLEFMLASMEIILEVWLLRYVPPDQEHVPLLQHPHHDAEYGDQAGDVEIDEDGDAHDEPLPELKWYQKVYSHFIGLFNINAALFFGILDAAFTKFYLLHVDHVGRNNTACVDTDETSEYIDENYFNRYIKSTVVYGRIFLTWIPGLLVAVHCYGVMKSFRRRRPHAPRLYGSDIILILAAIGNSFLSAYQFVISINAIIDHDGNSDNDQERETFRYLSIASAVESFMPIPQVIISTVVIHLGQNRLPERRHPLFHTLQTALTFLTLFSFVRWAIDSFFEMEFLSSRSEYDHDHGVWKVFVKLFLPFRIYFRYVSVILFLKIKKLMRERPVQANHAP